MKHPVAVVRFSKRYSGQRYGPITQKTFNIQGVVQNQTNQVNFWYFVVYQLQTLDRDRLYGYISTDNNQRRPIMRCKGKKMMSLSVMMFVLIMLLMVIALCFD
jgi:hypothetical protein